MKNVVKGLGLGLLVAACSGGGGMGLGIGRLATSQFLTAEDLGLPDGGLIDPAASFEPLLREDGVALVAEAPQTAQVVTNVAENESLDLVPGTRVAIVARNGDWLRIAAKVKDSDGRDRIIEGFVKASDISYLGPQTEGHTIDLFPTAASQGSQRGGASNTIEGELSSREVSQGEVSGSLESMKPIFGTGSVTSTPVTQTSTATSSPAKLPDAELNSSAVAQPSAGSSSANQTAGSSTTGSSAQPSSGGSDSAPATERTVTLSSTAEFDDGGQPVAGSCKGALFSARDKAASCAVGDFLVRPEKGARPVASGSDTNLVAVQGLNYLFGNRRGSIGGCLVAGELLRRRGDSNTYFEIKAPGATKIRVKPEAQHFGCRKGGKARCREDYEDAYVMKDVDVRASDDVHKILLEDVLSEDNRLRGGTQTFKFMPIDRSGKLTGSCTLTMLAASPVVLDLANVGRFEGPNLGESDVRFDVLGNGREVQTGWVAPSMGLLALDRDGDGKITSGAELFGEGTRRADGSTYNNGYVALAAHDDNRDGIIDSRDSVFNKLIVWRDDNSDGKSAPSELIPLAKLGITGISVVFGPSFRHGAPALGENDVRYESRYFGPKACGSDGCLSFDVFFATGSASVAGR